ncbi:DUF5004 domain-containing protein [Parabacteroides goldsteinii]|uniref:DUF5004 domain-containing protein n=1 Tax=Parabacteroides goldsteinii TaxID=328812 RepID=UPI00241DF5B2|nr:DUF5004 domain-containing protein [Parabacteroides goldsteinii]
MKKYVFTIAAFFVMCMASLAMVSCSDDDKEDSKTDESLLIGKWALSNLIYEDESETETDSFETSEEADVIIFNEDGTCRNYCKPNDQAGPGIDPYDWNDYGEWKLVNSTSLKLLFYGEGQQTVKVLKMTASTLSFEASITDEGDSYKYTMIYQKVN